MVSLRMKHGCVLGGIVLATLCTSHGFVCPTFKISATLDKDCHGTYDVMNGTECNGRPVFKNRDKDRYIAADGSNWHCIANLTCNASSLVSGPTPKTNQPLGRWGVYPNNGRAYCESPISLVNWGSFLLLANTIYNLVDNDTQTCLTATINDFNYSQSAVIFYSAPSVPQNTATQTIRMKGPRLPCHFEKSCDFLTTIVATDVDPKWGQCTPFCGTALRCEEVKVPTTNGTDCEYHCPCPDMKCGRVAFVFFKGIFNLTPSLEICHIEATFS